MIKRKVLKKFHIIQAMLVCLWCASVSAQEASYLSSRDYSTIPPSPEVSSLMRFGECFAYDENGNVTRIVRGSDALTGDGTNDSFDDLTLEYDGNVLFNIFTRKHGYYPYTIYYINKGDNIDQELPEVEVVGHKKNEVKCYGIYLF